MISGIKWILASASPRRKELLTQIGIDFEVVVSEADENIAEKLSPGELVERLSLIKAGAVRDHLAAGAETADKNSVTVTFPNNQAEGTKRVLGFRRFPTVESGGVITMRIDTKKQERIDKPKEKIDWGVEVRNSLSALVSVVSILLLINNLK